MGAELAQQHWGDMDWGQTSWNSLGRVLGHSSCFARCLKILEPDKMGLEGGFSHGFEFFKVF